MIPNTFGPGRGSTTQIRHPHARRVLGIACIAILFASGCSAGGTASGESGTELTIALPGGPVSLDPAKDSYTWLGIRSLTNASITHIKPDGTVGPGLAKSFRYIGTGNRDFEFTLRDDAKFSDGTPVSAQAVKGWLDYFAKGTSASLALLKIKSIDTMGQSTVRLHLAEPNPIVPYLLSEMKNWGSVSSPKSVANPNLLGTQTFGAGPYVLEPGETASNSKYTLVPNQYYPDKSAIKYSKVVVKIISTASSRFQAVNTGQVQVAAGSSDTADAAKSSGLTIVNAKNDISGLWIADWQGKTNRALGDVRVRQALNYALDREAITTAIAPQFGTPTAQPFSADGYDKSYDTYYPHDVDKAKSLLASAGYPDGGITLNALTCSCLTGSDEVAQAIAGDLAKIGVKLNVDSTPTVSDYVSKRRTLKYGLVVYTIGGALTSVLYHQGFDPTSPLNVFKTDDPTLDKIYSHASTATDPTPFWHQMSQRITTQAYTMPVFVNSALYYVSDKVNGVALSASRPVTLASEWSPR